MAYSPRLWLMAIGWWNKIDQCRKLKLNLTQTWGVCNESWFRNALISKSVILWWQAKKGINPELEGANARRVLKIPSKRSLYLSCAARTLQHTCKRKGKVRSGYITIYASKGISTEVWKKPETTPGYKTKEIEETDVWRREKCIEKENVCSEEARRESMRDS